MGKTRLKGKQVNEDTLQDNDGDTKIEVEETADGDEIIFTTAGAPRMVIANNGKVGINVETPSHMFDVDGDIRIRGNDIRDSSGNSTIQMDGSSNVTIPNNLQVNGNLNVASLGAQNEIVIVGASDQLTSSNLLTIDSSNNRIGIGTTSPSVKLDMVGEAAGETQVRLEQNNTDADAPDMRFFKSRGTNASKTAVADNDNLAYVNSFAYDGANYQQAGAFGWNADGTDGDSTFSLKTRVAGTTADRLTVDPAGDIAVEGDIFVSGSIKTASDISFVDENGTYPTNTAGFFWDLNNDEARIFAQQPSSDQIDFYFKLSDNNGSSDRFVFWVDDYRGTSYDRYPLYMHGDNLYMHAPPSGTSGTPDLSNAKLNMPRGTTSGTTTTHKGRLFLDGDNSSDLYIRFQNNTENAYLFQDQSNSNSFKMESANDIAFNTGGANERMRIASGGDITVENNMTVNGDVISTSFKSTGDMTINAGGGDIHFEDNGTRRLTIEDGGNIGIGSLILNPSYMLHLKKNTTSPMVYIDNIATDDTDFIYAKSSMDVDPDSGSYFLRWVDNGNDSLYYVRGNGGGGSTVSTSFTAGHDTVIEVTDNLLPGMIVESTGEVWYKPTDITFETALPKCRLTTSAMSKKVYGVIGGIPQTDETNKAVTESGGKIINGYLQSPAFTSYGTKAGVADNEVHLNTMSIGEGVVWVTNINGQIENGDLICSSDITGHGQLQNDDIMRSITVAKCTENIPWETISDVVTYNGMEYKKYLAACTFHCG